MRITVIGCLCIVACIILVPSTIIGDLSYFDRLVMKKRFMCIMLEERMIQISFVDATGCLTSKVSTPACKVVFIPLNLRTDL